MPDTSTEPTIRNDMDKGWQSSVAWRIWRSILWPALAFMVALLLIPLLTPYLLIVMAYRKWLVNRIRRKCPQIELMNFTDALYFHGTNENPGFINGVGFFKGQLDIQKWRHQIDTRMVCATNANGDFLYKKLRMVPKVVWRRYLWDNCDKFDLDKIVFVYEGEPPRSEKELEAVIGDLCSQPIPLELPQWQVILIPCSASSADRGDYACMMRLHHSIGDGTSVVRMMLRSFGMKAEDVKQLQRQTSHSEKFGTKASLLTILTAILTLPVSLFNRICTGYEHNALHGPKLSGHKLAVWSKPISLDFIRRVKSAGECTVNDILMTCLSMAYGSYFRSFCSTTPEQLRCCLPVDVRQCKPDDTPLDNQFSLIFFELPLYEKSPYATLKEVKCRTKAIKQSAEHIIISWTLKYLLAILPNYASSFIIDHIVDQSSVVVSNVPGPTTPISVDGDMVQRAVFWPPQRADVGMAVSLLSYNGIVTVGFITDKNIMSNPKSLVDLFHDSLYRLAREFGVPEDVGPSTY